MTQQGSLFTPGSANREVPIQAKPKKICYAPNCERRGTSLGMCQTHYMRMRRYGDFNAHPFIKHGEARSEKRTAEYAIWLSMITRCTNPKANNYHLYGGRGIRICDKWRQSFMEFLSDVGRRPHPDLTIDRLDNDGHYEPGNVRWSTIKEQGNNRRTNHVLTVDGVSKTIMQWAESTGISRTTIGSRVQSGWSMSDAILVRPRRIKLTEADVREIKRLSKEDPQRHLDIAKRFGITRPTVSRILRGEGWTCVR